MSYPPPPQPGQQPYQAQPPYQPQPPTPKQPPAWLSKGANLSSQDAPFARFIWAGLGALSLFGLIGVQSFVQKLLFLLTADYWPGSRLPFLVDLPITVLTIVTGALAIVAFFTGRTVLLITGFFAMGTACLSVLLDIIRLIVVPTHSVFGTSASTFLPSGVTTLLGIVVALVIFGIGLFLTLRAARSKQ